MIIMKAHALLGHPDETRTRAAAKARGWEITRDSFRKCEACAVAKAKRKNIPRNTETASHVRNNGNRIRQATRPGERLYLDLSSLRRPKNPLVKTPFVSRPHMRLIHDEYSGCRFLKWFDRKNGMIEPTCELLHNWDSKGRKCKILRMDGAGENEMLEARLK